MKQSRSWETDILSVCKEVRFLWKLKLYYHFYKILPRDPVSNQLNTDHNFIPYSFESFKYKTLTPCKLRNNLPYLRYVLLSWVPFSLWLGSQSDPFWSGFLTKFCRPTHFSSSACVLYAPPISCYIIIISRDSHLLPMVLYYLSSTRHA